ncbi:hypothetical protein AVEN_138645-1 [Araneus ventricosus]|uniref:Uncharacterized protein n=1 Tax=Araneus ventricosus TaxID=182803 RepID=A0A4Y2E2N3_ARAVE|nr:hypothetical protein AVEN_138645-1 [Araneus ventricosus]
MKKVVEERGAQAKVNPLLKMRHRPLENHFDHRTANFAANSEIQRKKNPFLNEISRFSAYQKEFGKPDTYWYDKLRYRGAYHAGDDAKSGCKKGNKVSMEFRTRRTK